MKLLDLGKRVINYLENSKIPFIYYILTFFFAITLRNFLEIFSSKDTISFIDYLHYYFSYIALALSLILLVYLFTKKDIKKIAKVILPFFILLWITPIFDLIISKGGGYKISYFLPYIHDNLLSRYFTFFGSFPGIGITPGMRIEIGIVLLLSFFYFYLKNLKLIKSLFLTISIYTFIFGYFSVPILLDFIAKAIGLNYEGFSGRLLLNFYLFLILIEGISLLYFLNKKYFKIILKDIRFERIIHYILMFVLGIVLTYHKNNFNLNLENIFYFVFIPASIIFAWLFSVMTNNLSDYDIDKVSNKSRPHVKNNFDINFYKKLSWGFLLIAILYAAAVNFNTLFFILLFIGNYFLYSIPPLRLKRITFFSKLLIALNSLVLVMMGFMFMTGSLENFPNSIIALFLIGFTFTVNFIDIKDYEGDKKAGIKTLPVLIGLKKSKLVIGLFFLLNYLAVYLMFKKLWLIFPLLIIGVLQFYFINKKGYKEKYVFWTYLSSLIVLIFLTYTFPII